MRLAVKKSKQPTVVLTEPQGFAFDEARHRYTLNGIPLRSVTTLITERKRPFDAEAQAQRIAKRDGRNPKQILSEWEEKRNEASALGSEVHELIDRSLRARIQDGAPLPIAHPNPFVRVAMDFLAKEQDQGLQISASEARLVWPEKWLAGTIDLLAWKHGEWWLIDWKTNEKLQLQAEPNWKNAKMLDPVAHLDDCHGSHYALQLALYALILREVYSIEIKHRAIIHLSTAGWRMHRMPNLDQEARDILANQWEW